MRSCQHSTLSMFETVRRNVGHLASELMYTRDQLNAQLALLDPRSPEVLATVYRGTLSAVVNDLLNDAVSTLTALGVMDEEAAAERLLAAADLFNQLRPLR